MAVHGGILYFRHPGHKRNSIHPIPYSLVLSLTYAFTRTSLFHPYFSIAYLTSVIYLTINCFQQKYIVSKIHETLFSEFKRFYLPELYKFYLMTAIKFVSNNGVTCNPFTVRTRYIYQLLNKSSTIQKYSPMYPSPFVLSLSRQTVLLVNRQLTETEREREKERGRCFVIKFRSERTTKKFAQFD